ncbi:TetR/AcrR family transcriptional regulator [Clostridium tyrobutyricum]|uniref:TetR/AcrR family transcriptional regulator n=1 Tax=Clostridium tyrobutyricum TaxID=1519 RepID=UPI0002F0EEB1|nr:TetR/AcrR family transcriptional regulator [Clostridium tyrobutyricum]MBV4431269.1 TetR/AcrR family transcriptional regulator [Clostridium tyrobutyricum]MBV4438298.1 TetR/AcrR family transcriptional regulator [Clostridium tyrobutyricum]
MNSKNNSREKILNAATKFFQANGFNGTGLNEILKESKSPKGSLYYYFPEGKEQLALEAIQLASTSIVKKVKNTLSKHTDPVKAIKYLINNIINDLKQENKLQDISISLIALETYSSNERLRKACKNAFTALSNVYTDKLIESGFPEQRAEELGMTIEIMIEGAITICVTRNDTAPLSTISNSMDILLS